MAARDPELALERQRKLLLEECRAGVPGWFYISIAGPLHGPHGAVILRGNGPTDAWRLMHALGLYPKGTDCTTLTIPMTEDQIVRVREDQRWRLLTPAELETLGKI